MPQIPIDQSIQVALGYHQTGRLAQAEQIYRQILAVNPRHADALHLLGLIAGQRGSHADAVSLISRAIASSPGNASFYCNLGVFLQYQDKLDQAAKAYQHAVDLKPDYVEAHGNLGIVLSRRGDFTGAISCFQKALLLKPDAIETLDALGSAYRIKGEFANAVDCYQRVLAIDPNRVETRFNLGIAYAGVGLLEKSAECYQKILALDPVDASALCSLGALLEEKGSVDQAIAFFERAIAAEPDFLDAYANLANAQNQLGRFDQAIETCQKALKRNPDFADAHSNIGLALAGKGDHLRATQSYQRAIALKPDSIEAFCNLANAYCDIRDFDRAIESCRQAIAMRPDFADAHAALANTYLANGSFHHAVASYEQALALRPHYPEVLNNLGLSYSGLHEVDHAIASFRRSIEQNPNLEHAYGNLGNALKDKGLVPEAIAAYRQALEVNPYFVTAADNLLYTLIFDPATDAKTLLTESRNWESHLAKPLQKFIQPHFNDRDPNRPIRIGYVSPDFSEHPVGRFMLALIAAHDPDRYQVFCYSDGRRLDTVTEKLKSHAHLWRDTVGVSDAQLTEIIREDRIDILVDLALHMSKNRLLVFARKPAPVQATFAGYPGTTGLQTIDYRITDPYLDPPGDVDRVYSEKTVRLPDTFWCDPFISQTPAVNDAPISTNRYVTFGSLNNFCKVNDSVLSLWTSVLKAVEGSHLLMLAPQGTARQRVLDRLCGNGIDPRRIEFVGLHPREEYLAIYHRIDIGLDTWPYNGHATSFDSFWMGVPVVTLVGQTVVGRAGLSQLMNLGLPELIANTRDEYVKIAATLANDPNHVRELRASLRDRMRKSPLMDIDRFAKGMENAYRNMWQTWCRNPA